MTGPMTEQARAWVFRNEAALVAGARAGISAVLAWLAAVLLHQPEATWPVISAIIVSRGGSAGSGGSARERFIGTLAGAGLGLVMAWLRGFGLPDGALLFLAIAPLAFLSVEHAAFRAAPVAAMIVMAASFHGHEAEGLGVAVLRIGDVGLGTAVALFVSAVLFRVHPTRAFRADAAPLMPLLASLFLLALRGETEKYEKLNNKVRRDMRELVLAARTLAPRDGEAGVNRFAGALTRTHAAVAYCVRALQEAHRTPELVAALAPFAAAVRQRCETVRGLLLSQPAAEDGLAMAQGAARDAIARIRETDPAAHLDALPFLIGCLAEDLEALRAAAAQLRKS